MESISCHGFELSQRHSYASDSAFIWHKDYEKIMPADVLQVWPRQEKLEVLAKT